MTMMELQVWKKHFLFTFFIYVIFFYQLFWAQACPEGMGTNETHRSHARCYSYPIPQSVRVGHTTGV